MNGNRFDMKRRKAIQTLALGTAGIAILPGCEFHFWPEYSNIPLEVPQRKLFTWLTEAIIPYQGTPEVVVPEETPHFVLTNINDCFDPEDIEIFNKGLAAFQQQFPEGKVNTFKKMTPEEKEEFLTKLLEGENTSKELRYFLSTTRELCIRQFTTSEYFLKTIRHFEFIPGRFNGCIPV